MNHIKNTSEKPDEVLDEEGESTKKLSIKFSVKESAICAGSSASFILPCGGADG